MPELLAMIKELADYENLADQVAITEDDLRQTLFGPDAIVYDTVVEDEQGQRGRARSVVPDVLDLPGPERESGSRTSTSARPTAATATPANC